uniref:Structural maintenance of chromosomes protein 1 n=1 Tax=Lygus hesperus TaxID=30085 RepID=A0A0A9X251_LYGHE
MEQLMPLVTVATQLVSSETQLGERMSTLAEAKERARAAHAAFAHVKEQRTERFMTAFEKIQSRVNAVYQELTLGPQINAVHGVCYLTLEDREEPYLGGTNYHATPPLKRFMPMESLSGGEKTMAALALLFAIHTVSSTPFIILDEVDAALDAVNVEKLARYLRTNCVHGQYIVISLKDALYHLSDVLVGVVKDKDQQSSRVLMMDLCDYTH